MLGFRLGGICVLRLRFGCLGIAVIHFINLNFGCFGLVVVYGLKLSFSVSGLAQCLVLVCGFVCFVAFRCLLGCLTA